MKYFRADAQMIAKMVDKDCLRYTADNIATLITIFNIPSKSSADNLFPVLIVGDQAETISRLDSSKLDTSEAWFEVKGQLRNKAPSFGDHLLPNISVRAESIEQIPEASNSLVYCEVIGRLTSDAEHITKSTSFEFMKYSLAVNRDSTDKANFFDISVFKPLLMEQLRKQTSKGASVFSAGELTFYAQGNKPVPSYAIKLECLISFM